MKAVIINKYGSSDELKLVEVPQPTIKPNEVLVKNHYLMFLWQKLKIPRVIELGFLNQSLKRKTLGLTR